MLPENAFPVTGGIMQTEEVGSRAQSTGIDDSLTDSSTYPHSLHLLSDLQSPLPSHLHMAVKQEPREEDDSNGLRSSSNVALNSQQAEPCAAPTSAQVTRHGHDMVHQAQQGSEAQTPHDNITRSRPSRGRRKSRWKLKFHHQALPPEYLDHYEAALAQEALNTSPTQGLESTSTPRPASTTSISNSASSPVTDVQVWLQRIAAMQQELCPRVANGNNLADSALQSNFRRSVITSASHAYPSGHNYHNLHNKNQQQSTPRPPMKYSDLPYMGEMTLDNSKPRRGRKPKKADICHLIYKNYGTILPGTPGHEERKQSPKEIKVENHREVPFQRTDIQNRISSLLEKRLTQESRRSLALSGNHREQDEPLNLCIKDLNQLKIRLLRKHGNVYESGRVKSETSSDEEDIECLGSPSVIDPTRSNDPFNNPTNNNNNINTNKNNHKVINNNMNNNNSKEPINQNPGIVYWPNTGVLIHPMALQSQFLYYQDMPPGDKTPPVTDSQPKEQKIVPKSIYSMLDSNSPTSNRVPVLPFAPGPPPSPRPKRIAPIGQPLTNNPPTKRKRSAIFIPPMPTENSNNPATEVSICKFKFTGGAKPSLQEKKSLSVDSGGNFRYYSGTGDKSMRGYEFFPRESLQQPAGQAGSSAGAFLSATGERIQPPQCQRLENLKTEEGRKKRKTRKSLQREKLEQTFKEKGFLIQTQQLESAEGATYCKFRQLRKFTRYLFRSWKDYLPGNVQDLSGNNLEGEGTPEIDGDQHSPLPISAIVDKPKNVLDEERIQPLNL